MKNKLRLKQYITSTLIVFICLFVMFLILNIYEYKTYTKNFNSKISAIVTLVKDNVTDPGKVAYVDKSTLSLTLPDAATVTFALADLGLEAKAAVTVAIDGKTSTASAS